MTLSLEDRLEIQELYASYAQLIDAGEAEKWAQLFTPDGIFSARSTREAPWRESRGTAELVAWCREHYRRNYAERKLRHGAYSIVLKETANGASGTAYAIVFLVGDGRPAVIRNTSRYEDEFVKGPDGWRFQARRVTRDE